eukprot:TRINITY_DN51484_c0_g1_i1.p1 TRINITY_DN51484_c0_g1~~TRINITY_DN51484_c0_g1_i1.p1  ORF type:complete len:428 (-),score=88.65 TRINITY_DN51484_c0_g1_i1:135-1418(-)
MPSSLLVSLDEATSKAASRSSEDVKTAKELVGIYSEMSSLHQKRSVYHATNLPGGKKEAYVYWRDGTWWISDAIGNNFGYAFVESNADQVPSTGWNAKGGWFGSTKFSLPLTVRVDSNAVTQMTEVGLPDIARGAAKRQSCFQLACPCIAEGCSKKKADPSSRAASSKSPKGSSGSVFQRVGDRIKNVCSKICDCGSHKERLRKRGSSLSIGAGNLTKNMSDRSSQAAAVARRKSVEFKEAAGPYVKKLSDKASEAAARAKQKSIELKDAVGPAVRRASSITSEKLAAGVDAARPHVQKLGEVARQTSMRAKDKTVEYALLAKEHGPRLAKDYASAAKDHTQRCAFGCHECITHPDTKHCFRGIFEAIREITFAIGDSILACGLCLKEILTCQVEDEPPRRSSSFKGDFDLVEPEGNVMKGQSQEAL